MSETNTSQEEIIPTIVQSDGVDPGVSVDPLSMAEVMSELSISDEAIQDTTVILDPKNRFLNRGTHYPNRVGRLRFWSNQEVQKADGDIIRLSTKIRGKDVPEDSLNRTLVHEFVHCAQQERHDKKLTEGHVALYGLAAAGLLVGNRIISGSGKKGVAKTLGTLMAGYVGYQAGYMVAPHERQAREIAGTAKRPGKTISRAIKRV